MSEYDELHSGCRCDRCAEEHPVLRFALDDEHVYWLCYSCVDAVCCLWLVEHAELIARHRALLSESEQAERESA